VAILDRAFDAVSATMASAEKNLINAREIYDRRLNSVFAARAEWSEKNLAELAEFKNGLNFTKSSKGETISIVGVKDFQQNFWVPIGQLETVQIDGALNDSYLLQKGDLLVVRSNGNKQLIGRCLLTPDVPRRTSHSGFTIRIRISSSDVEPVYLAHYLKSGAMREALIESGGGTNISSLNQQALSALPVFFPSRANQIKIIEELEILKSEVAQLEEIYRKKVVALIELKQAILGRAFAGELNGRRTPLDVAAE
jgi:type I restriction enzyme S subunit